MHLRRFVYAFDGTQEVIVVRDVDQTGEWMC